MERGVELLAGDGASRLILTVVVAVAARFITVFIEENDGE